MARGRHGVQLVISDAHTGLNPPSPPRCWEPAGKAAGSTSGDPCARHGGDRSVRGPCRRRMAWAMVHRDGVPLINGARGMH
jgi:hypothetical protein